MPSHRKGYLDTPEGQLHYRFAGEGEPLLLLHQNPYSSLMWENVLPRFAALGYRAVALDMPGYGESDRPERVEDIHFFARRSKEAMDALGMTPAYVIGHHSGSMIGAQMAVDFPGSVRKLVVWGYPLMDEAHRQNLLNAAPLEYSADGHELQDQWNGRIAFNGPTFTTALNLRCTLERLHAGREWFRLYNAVGGADFHGVAAALDVPVLVMSGRRDMVWEESQLAAKAIRGASFLEIPGSGVYVADEQPEEFVAGVHGFFRG